MRPIESHETLIIPDGDQQTCPHCGLYARGACNIDIAFGFRRMGNDRVYPQSWCKICRKDPRRADRFDEGAFARSIQGHPGAVYLIAIKERGLVKIGYTQAHPLGRMATFQTSSPDDLKLIGWWGSDYFGETEIHELMRQFHHRGEWFAMESETAREIVEGEGGTLWTH